MESAENARLQVLCLHETRPRRHPPHQEYGVSPRLVELTASPFWNRRHNSAGLCYTIPTQEVVMDAAENQIVVYQPSETVRLDVRLENETVWLTQSIFYQNKFWDAKSLLIKLIRRAKKELIVIDAYPGVATLDMLAKRGRVEREAA